MYLLSKLKDPWVHDENWTDRIARLICHAKQRMLFPDTQSTHTILPASGSFLATSADTQPQ